MILVSIVIGLGVLFYQKLFEKRSFIFGFVLLMGTIGYNLLQYYIIHVPFLNARGSLLFIPLVGINLGFGLQAMVGKNQKIGLILTMFM